MYVIYTPTEQPGWIPSNSLWKLHSKWFLQNHIYLLSLVLLPFFSLQILLSHCWLVCVIISFSAEQTECFNTALGFLGFPGLSWAEPSMVQTLKSIRYWTASCSQRQRQYRLITSFHLGRKETHLPCKMNVMSSFKDKVQNAPPQDTLHRGCSWAENVPSGSHSEQCCKRFTDHLWQLCW